MSEGHDKYYNPPHEDDYGYYMEGWCDSNQIGACKRANEEKSIKLCLGCPLPDKLQRSCPRVRKDD